MRFIDAYYTVRPFIPRRLQVALRRCLVRVQRRCHSDIWPIDPTCAARPEGWPGWPDGKRFALVLTHDVDTERGLKRCGALMSLEEEAGFRSSFNFVPERYPLPAAIREEARRRGFEVGVHGLKHDGKLYRSRSLFMKNATRINAYLRDWQAEGFRSPAMQHNLEWIHALDILYDASTFDTDPFEPQSDGVGTIFPFWVPGAGSAGYAELPYTLPQDSTLFMLMRGSDIDIWKKKLDWVVSQGGMALINTHPDYMSWGPDRNGPEEYPASFYRQWLDYVRERYQGEYWHALPRDVARFTARTARKPTVPTGSKGVSSMKICILRHAQFPDCVRVQKEVLALLEAGHQVDIVCLASKGRPAVDRFRGARILRIPLHHKRGGNPRYVFEYGCSFLCMSLVVSYRFLRRRYDVVQVNTMPDFLVFAAWLPKLLGAKVLLDLHEPTPELWQTKRETDRLDFMWKVQAFLEQRAIRFANRAMTVTQALRRRYGERGADISNLLVLPNVCNEEFAPPEPIPPRPEDGTFRLITHGLIEHRYGHEITLRAIQRLAPRMPDLRFDILGDGEYGEAVKALIEELDLQKQARMRGFLPYEEMMRFLTEADVGIVAMLSSPYSKLIDTNKMYEYMALRKPVILPRLPAIEDNFDDSCVSFFEPGNPEDLARCIEELRNHPEKRRERVANAYLRYDEMKWSHSKLAYLKVLEEMTANPRAPYSGKAR